MLHWTVDQVTAMAPDAAGVSAGRKLAVPATWEGLGCHESMVWGAIRGSGKTPYVVGIDGEGPAFKCSCPSRKFPCKHGVALGFLVAEHLDAIPVAEPPSWMTEWVASRRERETKQRDREAQRASEPIDDETRERRERDRERRVEKREANMTQGVAMAREWLRDLVRRGLARTTESGVRPFEEFAARLVDAQCPGLASRVRELSDTMHAERSWQDLFLERVGRLHLLLEAAARLDTEAWREVERYELRSQLGVPLTRDEVFASGERRQDRFAVLAVTLEVSEGLRVRRAFAFGCNTRTWVMLLDFAHAAASFPYVLVPDVQWEGEVVCYPGLPGQRVLPTQDLATRPLEAWPGEAFLTIAENEQRIAAEQRANPWLELWPVGLRAVRVHREGVESHVVDADRRAWALHRSCDPWILMAMGARESLDLVGTWDGHALRVLAAEAEGDRIHFGTLESEVSV